MLVAIATGKVNNILKAIHKFGPILRKVISAKTVTGLSFLFKNEETNSISSANSKELRSDDSPCVNAISSSL